MHKLFSVPSRQVWDEYVRKCVDRGWMVAHDPQLPTFPCRAFPFIERNIGLITVYFFD